MTKFNVTDKIWYRSRPSHEYEIYSILDVLIDRDQVIYQVTRNPDDPKSRKLTVAADQLQEIPSTTIKVSQGLLIDPSAQYVNLLQSWSVTIPVVKVQLKLTTYYFQIMNQRLGQAKLLLQQHRIPFILEPLRSKSNRLPVPQWRQAKSSVTNSHLPMLLAGHKTSHFYNKSLADLRSRFKRWRVQLEVVFVRVRHLFIALLLFQ
ncbi:MAG TPA: hypothetical protein VIU12_25715 [Chryseolinea sp.]